MTRRFPPFTHASPTLFTSLPASNASPRPQALELAKRAASAIRAGNPGLPPQGPRASPFQSQQPSARTSETSMAGAGSPRRTRLESVLSHASNTQLQRMHNLLEQAREKAASAEKKEERSDPEETSSSVPTSSDDGLMIPRTRMMSLDVRFFCCALRAEHAGPALCACCVRHETLSEAMSSRGPHAH